MATRIKRYEAQVEDYDSLLARIESEMGPGAELETRRFRRGGFLGLFGGQWMIEVVAILEVGTLPEVPADRPVAEKPAVDPTREAPVEGPVKESGPAVPPAGRQRKVDLTADAPIGIAEDDSAPAIEDKPVDTTPGPVVRPAEFPRATLGGAKPAGAEARITTDALRFASQRAVEPAAGPEPGPATKPIPPAAETPDVNETAQPQSMDAPSAGDSGNSASEISELKESISELRETIKLLAEQQKEALAQKPEPPTSGRETNDPVIASLDSISALDGGGRVADPVALDPASGMQDAQRRVFDRLLDWNIRSYDALELINNALAAAGDGPLPGEDDMLGLIFRDVCRNILVSEGIKLNPSPPGKVVALVGATGVGKTTTIAKLAAHFAFQNNARVSFVSLDNYRIAAAEQLRTYADIMGLDLDIVFSHEEFDQVLTERRSCDLTLVDTAGRSPTNTKQIYELREIFSAHPPDEVHLVVSASTKADDLRMLLDNFEPLSYDHVIISKLDETRSLGCLYNLSKYCQLPISYFTVGQSVPEDIRTANLAFVRTWIEQGRIT